MSSTQLAPAFRQQFFDSNGLPLNGGQVFTYAAGTTTPLATYTDETGNTPNTNPIILDSSGKGSIWIGSNAYKFVIEDSLNNVIQTVDNVQSPLSRDVNGNFSANNFLEGYTTTATAAGTTTLLVGSTRQQFFTGSTTQTVLLPVVSTLVLGQSFTIVNNSSGVVTVQSSGANTLQAMAGSSQLIVTCIAITGTGTASWSWTYIPILDNPLPLINGGTGTAAASANAAFNALSPMTTGGDIIYGGASGVATRLDNGTVGQVLTSQGTTLPPKWAADAAKQIVVGSAQTTDVTTTSTTFASLSTAITISFTAAVTATYKLYALAGGQNSNQGQSNYLKIVATTGSPTILQNTIGLWLEPTIGGGFTECSNTELIVNLTGGVAYVFELQAKTTGGTMTITCAAEVAAGGSGLAVIAEQIS